MYRINVLKAKQPFPKACTMFTDTYTPTVKEPLYTFMLNLLTLLIIR